MLCTRRIALTCSRISSALSPSSDDAEPMTSLRRGTCEHRVEPHPIFDRRADGVHPSLVRGYQPSSKVGSLSSIGSDMNVGASTPASTSPRATALTSRALLRRLWPMTWGDHGSTHVGRAQQLRSSRGRHVARCCLPYTSHHPWSSAIPGW